MQRQTKAMHSKAFKALALSILFAVLWFAIKTVLTPVHVQALPVGPTLTYISNSTLTSSPASRTDLQGYIHVITFDVTQQNTRWKAYVGNVTGKLTLDDASGNTIYDWTLTTIRGEVYASRSSSIEWASINCSNETIIGNEQTALGMTFSQDDSINSTFNRTNKYAMVTASITMPAGTCKSQFTYVNDASQESVFEELLLSDGSNLVYATFINASSTGFDGSTYDFQMIVADREDTAQTYYFWVELS
ncbi:hypothetical protein J7L02_03215 [Candidatus Woesearchaeota archaeon]|nr:hypothetical protein [Candidatus Woesearchaeota archaeon]